MIDYYEILDVAPDVSAAQLKQQYRFLQHAYHPDKFASAEHKAQAEERLKHINAAYEVLSNSVFRARYDEERKVRMSSAEVEADQPISPPGDILQSKIIEERPMVERLQRFAGGCLATMLALFFVGFAVLATLPLAIPPYDLDYLLKVALLWIIAVALMIWAWLLNR